VKNKVVILDCCRDNPFSAQLEAALSQVGKNIRTKSLGEITGYGPGFYLAFATSPGQTAADGNGERNSPFTAAILKTIPGGAEKDIDFFFREVKSRLPSDQVSWTNHSVTSSFPLITTNVNVWEVTTIEGREYVQGSSLQAFYRFAAHKVEGKKVWFRNPGLVMKGEIGTSDLLVNNIKIKLHHPMLEKNGRALISRLDLVKTIEPVIRPSYIGSGIQLKKVVLDPAYGGMETGAEGAFGFEKTYTLSLAQAVGKALEKRGIEAIYTRQNDTSVSQEERLRIINQVEDGVCVSIRFSSGEPDLSGFETTVLTADQSAQGKIDGNLEVQPGSKFNAENITLAVAVQAQSVHRLNLMDLGVQRKHDPLLAGARLPTIVVRPAYLTNPGEAELCASGAFINALAETFGDALVNYRRALELQKR
jgi:N-acetylmuramoyl-L-alanine amidase